MHECKMEERINQLEINQAVDKTEIKNLCKKLDELVGTMKWGIGLLIPTLLATIINLIMR